MKLIMGGGEDKVDVCIRKEEMGGCLHLIKDFKYGDRKNNLVSDNHGRIDK